MGDLRAWCSGPVPRAHLLLIGQHWNGHSTLGSFGLDLKSYLKNIENWGKDG